MLHSLRLLDSLSIPDLACNGPTRPIRRGASLHSFVVPVVRGTFAIWFERDPASALCSRGHLNGLVVEHYRSWGTHLLAPLILALFTDTILALSLSSVSCILG